MIKKILILFFTLLLLFYNKSVFGACADPQYQINACKTSSCNEMKESQISSSSNFPNFLDKISYQTIKYNDYLNNGVNKIKNYYGNNNFNISNYCIKEDSKSCFNKTISISTLLNTTSIFYIKNGSNYTTYNNGIDYFFKNISNNFFSGIFIPITSYFKNYISNNGLTFKLKNVCTGSICDETKIIDFSSNSSNKKLLFGTIKNDNFAKFDNVKIDENGILAISKSTMLAGSTVDVTFNFNDVIPVGNSSCTITKYKYSIYIKDINGNIIDSSTLIDDFIINPSNLTVFNNTKDLNADIKIIKLDGENNRAYFTVTDSLSITKSGKYYFYVQVEDFSGKETNLVQVNYGSLEVLSNINKPSIGTIKIDENNKYSGETFKFFLDLYDVYNNKISNKGIKLSYIGESDTGARFYFDDTNSYNYGPLPFIRESINFKMIFEKLGYHTNKFMVQYEEIDDNGNGIGKFGSLEISTPEKIYIKSIKSSDVPITCGNSDITLAVICTSDNLSGCNNSYTKDGFGNDITGNITFTSESDNNTQGFLTIIDNAYNIKKFAYNFNHLDLTPPSIEIFRGKKPFKNNLKSIVNSDILNITFDEQTAGECQTEVNYEVSLLENSIWQKLRVGDFFKKISNISIYNFFKTSGTKKLYVKITDKYGNVSEKNINFILYPDKINESESYVKLIDLLTKDSKFGNNYDEYEYELTLKDEFENPIFGKEVITLDTDCSVFGGCNNLKTIFQSSGGYAIQAFSSDYKTDINGKVYFNLKSLAPGNFTEVFKIKMHGWDTDYNNINITNTFDIGVFSNKNSFKKPIAGELIIEGGDIPQIGKDQKYKINLSKVDSNNITLDSNSDGKLNISESTIIDKTDGHFWNTFGNEDNSFGFNIDDYLGFTGSIDTNTGILDLPEVSSNNLIIAYNLGGEEIKYYLDNFGINGCDVETLGLKVIGTLQGGGKSDITGQEDNFSDLSKSELRSTIRMNAYKLIKGRTSGDIINGIMYIEGDTTISGNDLGYETLIVKNGNVVIDGNLNINNKKLGIIILKDNYLIESDYNNIGNIYVNKDVENINAIIYADGAFRSADSNGDSYPDSELSNKLNLNGSLFTRNTIGGAVVANTTYLLPGGQETDIFDLAEIYDLNYIRKVNNSCDVYEDYSFLIKYNSIIQTDPPIGFSTK